MLLFLLIVLLAAIYVMAGVGFVRSMETSPQMPRTMYWIVGAAWLPLVSYHLVKQCFVAGK
jgi:uncharacterized membrane protein YphA (DoxX/SURF4 family)